MNTPNFYKDTDGRFGVDLTKLMIEFIGVIHCEPKDVILKFEAFERWISLQIKRKLTPGELTRLNGVILRYVQSEPGTNERIESIDYLMNLRFIL